MQDKKKSVSLQPVSETADTERLRKGSFFKEIFRNSVNKSEKKFLENIERDNEVKKTKIVCNFKNSRFFRVAILGTAISNRTRRHFIYLECLLCNDSQIREREEERTEDALASGDEEGRGKLRKAPGICKQDLIR